MTPTDRNTWRVTEQVARQAYSRLLAWLAYQWRDVTRAEDALSEALLRALETWPRDGVPDAPEAWLLTVAKRELLQQVRHQRTSSAPAVMSALEMLAQEGQSNAPEIPDDRLRLLFVCAHPAIDASIHTALMLQTVLGFEAAQVASLYLTSPAALAQRLVRAKAKIRAAGISFESPESSELAPRLQAVLEAIYGAYAFGWSRNEVVAFTRSTFADEALYLARLVSELLPEEPEALGLRALLELCESRNNARQGSDGTFVPLHEQDIDRWDRHRIVEANSLLWRASALNRPGRFQLEAAIQAAHAQRAFGESVPWSSIAQLYHGLRALAPTLGAAVAESVALAEGGDLARARQVLESLDQDRVQDYLPYWVARARLSELEADPARAGLDYERAVGLAPDGPIRRFLLNQATRLKR